MTSGAYVQCSGTRTSFIRSEKKNRESDVTMMRSDITIVLCVLLLFATTGETFQIKIPRTNRKKNVSKVSGRIHLGSPFWKQTHSWLFTDGREIFFSTIEYGPSIILIIRLAPGYPDVIWIFFKEYNNVVYNMGDINVKIYLFFLRGDIFYYSYY